jgi:micrococcal nuclease
MIAPHLPFHSFYTSFIRSIHYSRAHAMSCGVTSWIQKRWFSWRSRDRTKENTPVFDLAGKSVWVRCVSVYDGDTYQVVFRYAGKWWRWKCRCVGWDSPELRTKNEEEKKLGYEAKAKMEEWWQGEAQVARLDIQGWDKYGRLLTHHQGLKEYMFSTGLVKAYDGGTKESW